MPAKIGPRPRAGMGLSSAVTEDRTITKPGTRKVARNRNRTKSAKPPPVGRRQK